MKSPVFALVVVVVLVVVVHDAPQVQAEEEEVILCLRLHRTFYLVPKQCGFEVGICYEETDAYVNCMFRILQGDKRDGPEDFEKLKKRLKARLFGKPPDEDFNAGIRILDDCYAANKRKYSPEFYQCFQDKMKKRCYSEWKLILHPDWDEHC